MSMSSPLTFSELEFPPAPSSPSFAALFTDTSSTDLWGDQSISLMDDCDSVSLLSHSSGDETGSPVSFLESPTQFVDSSMMFGTSPILYENKLMSPTMIHPSFKTAPYRFETACVPQEQYAEPVVFEPVVQQPAQMHEVVHSTPVSGYPQNIAGYPQIVAGYAQNIPVYESAQPVQQVQQVPEAETSRKKSKRRAPSCNSSVTSAESNDSTKTRKPKRAKHSSCESQSSGNNSDEASSSPSSVPNVDSGLVSSLLAESELKKNRLARKAELARLGRKAKNDQIEALETKLKELKDRLQAAKDHNAKLAIFPHGMSSVKIESPAASRLTVSEALSVLDVSYSAKATLVPRFMNWLSNQNERFYCESNTRGLFASLADKSLGMDEQQKRLFVHVLKSHAAHQPVTSVADRFHAVDQVMKQNKHIK